MYKTHLSSLKADDSKSQPVPTSHSKSSIYGKCMSLPGLDVGWLTKWHNKLSVSYSSLLHSTLLPQQCSSNMGKGRIRDTATTGLLYISEILLARYFKGPSLSGEVTWSAPESVFRKKLPSLSLSVTPALPTGNFILLYFPPRPYLKGAQGVQSSWERYSFHSLLPAHTSLGTQELF